MSPSPSRLFPLYALFSVLAVGLSVSACGGDGGSASNVEGVPYQVGESLEDSTVALVVSSEHGTDTVSARRYQRRMKMAMRRRSPRQRSGDQMQKTHRKLVRSIARQHAMEGEAKARDLSVNPKKVTARLKKLKSRYKSEKQFRRQLAQNNMTVDSVRSLLAARLRQRALRQKMRQKFEKPTEKEVKSYSKKNRRIRAQHILIKVGKNAPQSKVDSARQAAKALIDSAKMEGIKFSALARRHSEGPSAKRGGDLGFFTREKMVDPFAKAAFALSDSGDVAPKPVRTRFGFHVIRLTNPGKPMETAKARKQMTQKRKKQAVKDQVNALLKEVTVQANPKIVSAGFYDE
ncbi:MAG: peptidylprolyl isomerase [Salinibacter sp.]|uniref:peptidylprolyl isomerase n=1 Tax=Salinibacter sp. TaxID=2065818 RepID=UPI0035D51FEF